MKLAVMVSGSGTLLASMIEQQLPIDLVVADKPCRGLQLAEEAGLRTYLLDRRNFGYRQGVGDEWRREEFSTCLGEALWENRIDVAAMAGFFTVLHPHFFVGYVKWLLNIHPALLPRFKGEFAVRDTLAAGASETGTTIHIATEELDDARYIVEQQAGVPVYYDGNEAGLPADTVETLWERIKQTERVVYPDVLRRIQSGDIDLQALYDRVTALADQ